MSSERLNHTTVLKIPYVPTNKDLYRAIKVRGRTATLEQVAKDLKMPQDEESLRQFKGLLYDINGVDYRWQEWQTVLTLNSRADLVLASLDD